MRQRRRILCKNTGRGRCLVLGYRWEELRQFGNDTHVRRKCCHLHLLGPCSLRKVQQLRRRLIFHLKEDIGRVKTWLEPARWSLLLTESFQTVFQLSQEHGAVLFLVVQLETFQEIFVAALVFLGSDLLVGVERGELVTCSHLCLRQMDLLVRRLGGIPRLRASSLRASWWHPSSRTSP